MLCKKVYSDILPRHVRDILPRHARNILPPLFLTTSRHRSSNRMSAHSMFRKNGVWAGIVES
jgi:cation transport regulator ChaB